MLSIRILPFLSILGLSLALALSGCARSKVQTQLIDRKYQVYEVAMQSFEECGGLWQGSETCVANLRPQIRGVAGSLCGKPPARIHSCATREAAEGRQVYCVVECNQRPDVDDNVLQRAERCQRQGGVWVNDRCELNLQ